MLADESCGNDWTVSTSIWFADIRPATIPASLLKEDETTLADKLGAGGYITSLVGKWHLGYGLESIHQLVVVFKDFSVVMRLVGVIGITLWVRAPML